MRRLTFCILAALTMASPGAARAQEAGPATEVSDGEMAERRAAAMKLADILYSDQRQAAAVDGAMLGQMEAFFRADPNFQALEAESPGLIDKVMEAMRPLLIEFAYDEAPEYRRGIAPVFARHLTAAQLEEGIKFYTSPLGQKLLDRVGENLSVTSMLAEMEADIDAPTSERAVNRDMERTAVNVLKGMSASELAGIRAMEKTEWSQAFERARPAMVAFDTAFTNSPAPEFEAKVEAVMTRILEENLGSAGN